MPSDNRRRKDDTWTQDELNRALKGGSKEDRKRGDRDRRHHGEDSERRRHRDDGEEKRSRRHRDRDESPEVQLTETEEDRERMRRERREKKEKGKEQKPRHKEMKPEKGVRMDDNDDDRKRRHDERRERKSHGDEESTGHRDNRRRHDRDGERRHRDDEERERRKEKESRHHRDGDNDDDERRRRHREKESSSRRHHDEEDRHRRHRDDDKHTSSSRRHHKDEDGQGDNDRQQRHHNGSERRRHRDEGDDEEERERQRQERRERREREKQKEKENDRDKDRERHREDREKRSERTSERSRDHHREDRGHGQDRYRNDRDDNNEGERRGEHKISAPTPSFSLNGKHQEEEEEKQADDDYNYEEDFEDYEDDFEDEEDPEMKEDGEMEEVLRALDEENNRLHSNSRRSNWSDSTELSDERFKDHREEEDRRPKNVSRGKSFINFISAKQRVMDSTVASKARKRFTDLSKLIELDVARYDMFDLPPVGEYELYIRNFGRSDTKQAYVQTGDDDIEREVQTEEIESLSKWTQHPSDQDAVVGGEGIAVVSSGESVQGPLTSDSDRLQKFLDRVGQFLFTILDEESISSTEESRKRDGTPSASFSQSTSKLGLPQFLEGRQVKALSFCPSDPNSLLSIHSLPHETSKKRRDLSEIRASSPINFEEKPSSVDHLYILCIWNLSQTAYPYRICVSEMTITCACFSPTKASIVFAGMYDGSVSLWDLREPAAQHKSLEHKGDSHNVRYPTYMTAGVLEAENHKSPVKAITAVHSSVLGSLRDEETAESSSGLSFQLASVEEKSAVNLWVVAEIPVPDPAGSENDLGLSPGGKIKLIRSSIILLNNPNKYLSYSQEIKALDIQLNPADLNHFYVTTDAGCVVHGVRFGKRAYPPAYSPLVASPVPMVTMDFSPFGQPYFLAGCQDGTLYLFHIRSEHPIAIWREFVSGETILSVRWSRSRPAVFFVLDNNSNILTFDLVENGLTPVKTDNIRTADAICMEIGSDPDLLTPGVSRPAQMAFALDNGTIECLSVSDQMRKQQPLEEDFLASYIDRY